MAQNAFFFAFLSRVISFLGLGIAPKFRPLQFLLQLHGLQHESGIAPDVGTMSLWERWVPTWSPCPKETKKTLMRNTVNLANKIQTENVFDLFIFSKDSSFSKKTASRSDGASSKGIAPHHLFGRKRWFHMIHRPSHVLAKICV